MFAIYCTRLRCLPATCHCRACGLNLDKYIARSYAMISSRICGVYAMCGRVAPVEHSGYVCRHERLSLPVHTMAMFRSCTNSSRRRRAPVLVHSRATTRLYRQQQSIDCALDGTHILCINRRTPHAYRIIIAAVALHTPQRCGVVTTTAQQFGSI